MTGMDKRKWLAWCKAIMQRGSSWTDMFYSKLLLTLMFIKLFETTITGYGIPLMPLYALGFVGVFVFNFTLGYLDLRYGFWRQESDVAWEVTPKANKLCDDGHMTRKIVEKICVKLGIPLEASPNV